MLLCVRLRSPAQPPRVRRLEEYLHERRPAALAPEVGAEHREIDGRDLVGLKATFGGQYEVVQVGRSGALTKTKQMRIPVEGWKALHCATQNQEKPHDDLDVSGKRTKNHQRPE